MSDHEKQTGLYSAEAASRFGTKIWADDAGTEFEITCYDKPSHYKWPDARIVAPVTHYVRDGSPPEMFPSQIIEVPSDLFAPTLLLR